MNLILNPSQQDSKKYGILAHVPQGERTRILTTMTAKGREHYCKWLENLIKSKKRGKA